MSKNSAIIYGKKKKMGDFIDFIEASMEDASLLQRFLLVLRKAADASSVQKFLLSEGFGLSGCECEKLIEQANKLKGKRSAQTETSSRL